MQQAHGVTGGGVAEAGVEFLGNRGAADDVPPLEKRHGKTGPGEVSGAGQAIVAGSEIATSRIFSWDFIRLQFFDKTICQWPGRAV